MIDARRWQNLTFYQQLGHVASELSRAVRFSNEQDTSHLTQALRRLLELLDLTIEDRKNTARLRELCRFKEVVGDWYCGTETYQVNPRSLLNYAMDFALLERREV